MLAAIVDAFRVLAARGCLRRPPRGVLSAFLAGAFVAAAFGFQSGVAEAQSASTPSVQIGTAALLSPTTADNWYKSLPGSTASTNGLGLTGYPNEIVELARALKNDPDQIYKYVRNNIENVWMYGLQKGALGAIVDKSGTAFDQAKLVVDLLRQAGYAASYQAGTITLNGAQFQAWSNITDATAACQLLSSGGIPAVINGTTSSDCSGYNHATITSVQLAHIWVSVTVNGQARLYDPAYKPHIWKAGLNLSSVAGLASGDALNGATSGMASGTAGSGVPYVQNLNASALNAKLQGYAQNLLSAIKGLQPTVLTAAGNSTGVPGAPEMEDVVGGGVIQRWEVPSSGWPQTSLPYTASAEYSWTGNIPDAYRTTLEVKTTKEDETLIAQGASNIYDTMWDVTLFVDEIYGRKLIIDNNFTAGYVSNNTDSPNEYMGYSGWLKVLDESGQGVTVASFSNTDDANASYGLLTLTARHPYASSANGSATPDGTYMALTASKSVNLTEPLTIVHAWGDASGLVAKWGHRQAKSVPKSGPVKTVSTSGEATSNPVCDTCRSWQKGQLGDSRREELAAAWIVQSSKAARLHAQIAGSIFQLHHSIGVVYGSTQPHTVVANQLNPSTSPYLWDIGDDGDVFDVNSGFSLTSRAADPVARRAAVLAIAATSDALEGSVEAQGPNLPDTASTATRFEWGNNPGAYSSVDPSNAGPRKFFSYNSANSSQAASLTKVQGGYYSACNLGDNNSPPTSPVMGSCEAMERINNLQSAVNAYTGLGFQVTASEEAYLGPGQRGSMPTCQVTSSGGTCSLTIFRQSKQRSAALVATHYNSAGDPDQIAHILVGDRGGMDSTFGPSFTKGGGGGAQSDHQATFDPSKAADILKARFVDHSKALGVDLTNGSLTYTAPVKLEVGNGEFPNKLTAQLVWRGGTAPDSAFGPIDHGAPQAPWTTNWNNNLTLSGSGTEAMGESDPRAAAGAIAAFLAAQDIYKSAPSAQRDVAAVLTTAWWTDQLSANVVTATVGASSRQFVKLVDTTWISPGPGEPTTLVQSGQRVAADWGRPCTPPSYSYSLTRGWDDSGLTFTVTGAHGDVQTFSYWEQQVFNDTCQNQHGFHLTGWTFPKGVSLTLTYGDPNSALGDYLLSVSNSLGRQIVLTYAAGQVPSGFTNGLSGTDARSVSYTETQIAPTDTMAVSDALGNTTKVVSNAAYWYGTSNGWYLLNQVFTPDNPNQANLQYSYDTLRRVNQAQDADAIQLGTRQPYNFFIANNVRGERDDPAGGVFSVEYDTKGRPIEYFDELGRETQAAYDGRKRVVAYTYPLGDQEQMVYDNNNNINFFTKIPTTGSTELANNQAIQIYAAWDPTWLKLASITNAYLVTLTNGVAPVVAPTGVPTTTFTYVASGNGAGEMASATRPAPTSGAAQPVYSFIYTNYFGELYQVTDPTGVATQHGYDASGNLTSVTVDPSHVNSTTRYGYTGNGELASTTDPNGNISNVTYDADGRKLLEISPTVAGQSSRVTVQHVYDAVGREIETDKGTTTGSTFTLAESALFAYDPAGNKLTSWTPTAIPTGQTPSQVIPVGLTQMSYDPLNRVQCSTVRMNPAAYGSLPAACALGTAGSYGADRITETVYDLAGQKLQEIRAYGTPRQYTYVTNTYTPDGKLQTVADANGNLTSYAYDGFDRLSATIFPASSTSAVGTSDPNDTEAYTYDVNGNRLSLKKRDGSITSWCFDALNRETTKYLHAIAGQGPQGCSSPPAPSGNDVQTAYDLEGRTTSATFAGSGQGVAYGYDTAGRLTSEATGGFAMNFGLDAAGNRIRVTWPDGFYAGYVYDGMNRVAAVNENGATSGVGVLAAYAYDNLGRRTGITRGNGTSASFGYDAADRLSSLGQTMPSDTAHSQTLGFAYSPASQLVTRSWSNTLYSWTTPPVAPVNSTYDGLNRDASIAGTATVVCPTYPSNPLPANAGYDCNGNQLQDKAGVRHFAYDIENRLTSVAGIANPVSLAYDPLGRLQTYTVGTGTPTLFLYEGSRLVAEYAGSTLLRRYVHGPGLDEPLVWYEGVGTSDRRWLHMDRQGSVIAQSNASGVVTQTYAYGPYGEPQAWGGSRFAYTGQIQLPEAQIYHYKARVYDPIAGRFLQTDPIGYKDDLDLYAYVKEDPLDHEDPTGECLQCATALIGGAVGAVLSGGAEAVSQMAEHNGQITDWGGVGTATLGGAVGGAYAGATGDVVGGGAIAGGVTGFADGIRNHEDAGTVAMRTGAGIVVGAATGYAGKVVAPLTRGTGALARNNRAVAGLMGRMAKGQIKNIAPKTAARIAVQNGSTSALPTAGATVMTKIVTCHQDNKC